MGLVKKIQRLFKEFGWFGGSLYAADRVLQTISPRMRIYYHYWMVQLIPDKPLVPPKYAEQLEVRLIEQGDPLFEKMPVEPHIMKLRIRQNAICLALFVKGEFAGFFWFTFGRYEEDEARYTFLLEPEHASVFDFNLYLFPKYRGGIAFLALWDGAARYLRKKGMVYSYSRLTAFTLVSAKSHSHFGWKRLGSAVVVRLWSLEIQLLSRAPYVFASLSDERRVLIHLTPNVLDDTGPDLS